MYGRDVAGRTVRPERVLVAFRRLPLEPGESARLAVEIPTSRFALWDAHDGWVVEPGEIQLSVGASSADIRLRADMTLNGSDHRSGRDRASTRRIVVETLI
ncbi:fibronectin type III-like domain-contianing protein [Kribbella sp. NPDC026611]|uniref:fibronectin type III-like domain-contianing protein n=1 Tax=Kribbella sp. NPDC026611 TaxID=3154911 RepID=UPI0033C247BA